MKVSLACKGPNFPKLKVRAVFCTLFLFVEGVITSLIISVLDKYMDIIDSKLF